ncbi:MAG TPA: S9 family peptidase [Terriglobia bacterium]|nr:S9 family peptidase [Terriglobia bacterium]
MKLNALLLIFTSLLWVATALAQEVWTPEISLKVQGINDVVPSPDGRLVAYTQTRAVVESEKSEWLSHIFLGQTNGIQPLQLTRGEIGAGSPAFSPDGRFVYFLSARSGKQNLWRIPVSGGESEKVTDWKGVLDAFKVSRDGLWIALIGAEPSEKEEKARKEKRDWRVMDDDPKGSSIWLLPATVDSAGHRPIRRLLSASYHVANIDWSPDSKSIAFEHRPDSGEDSWTRSDLSEVETANGKVRDLAVTGAAEGEPQYSPDGRFLMYMRTPDPARWAGQEEVVLLPVGGGVPRVVPTPFDEGPTIAGLWDGFYPSLIPRMAMGVVLGWASDSQRLLFAGEKGTHFLLYAVSLDGRTTAAYAPQRGILRGARLNANGTHVGFSQESPGEPPEAFVMNLSGGPPARVSLANSDLPKLSMGVTKKISWKSKDGLEIEGLLTLPVGYGSGNRVPLVLVIHGGPMSYFNESFVGNHGIYPLATFAGKGYAVLRPNIRGSGGYGRTFRLANLNDWGGKDYEDLMAGVDSVITMGVADPDRLAVMGWSYGGYMTSWVITQTKRFKAAVVGAGVTNLWSFDGTTDIPGFLPDYFSGEPWDKFEAYYKHSAMAHVKGVTTPTLILHGEADLRVPISQGYELYNALKRQGVTTEMVVYPRMAHGPSDPKFELDIMQRHLEWLERYLH